MDRHDQDRNRRTFEDNHVVDHFVAFEGWLDAGERVALQAVAPEVRGQPILDLGVGAGRTTSLLRLMSDEYVAIDYSVSMVDVFRRLHAGVDIRTSDARSLGDLPDDHFGLVLFSNNGIDTVDRDGRAQVLAGCHRVLRPGGLLLVTMLNLEGVSYGEVPWQLHRPHRPPNLRPKPVLLKLARSAAHPIKRVEGWYNFFRFRSPPESGDGWAYGLLAAHEFRLRVHFTTLQRARKDVEDAGFTVQEVYSSDDGSPLTGDDAVGTDYLYVLARRSG